MELRLYIQQAPQYNIQQQQIYYDGPNPNSLKLQFGGLPQARQWPQYNNYIDVTGNVSDLFKLKLTLTNDRDADGASSPGAFQSKKSVSGSLAFEGEAYKLIKKWLVEDVSAPLNSVAVKIEHVHCGTYEDYVFKAADLRWCEGSVCVFDISLRQKDEALNCIKRTMITAKDNDRDWFPVDSQIPSGGKQHPRFSYCNEIRPNGLLIIVWSIGSIVWTITAIILGVIYAVVNAIIFVINNIIKPIVNAVISVVNALGGNVKPMQTQKFLDFDDIIDDYEQKYIESAGCGREHPAPLVRDYIYNVCKICGIDTDSLPATAPVFFSQTIAIETSNRGVINVHNDHYNACYFNAPVKRGIRRFPSINIFSGSSPNATDFWIPDNAPQLMLDMFLDELKGVYNAEWRIKGNKLYFQRKDYFVNGGYVLDITEHGPDRDKLLEGVCFEWNEIKYPAVARGLYTQDGVDTCGNEALKQMNGLDVVFGKTDENPNFEGILDKTVRIGATKFRLDGASTDYLYDAMSVVLGGSAITVGLMSLVFSGVICPKITEYADYAVLLKDETCGMPKLLIWDGASYTNARAVRSKAAAGGMPLPQPVINMPYNNYPTPTPWDIRHQPQTKVIAFSGNQAYGRYQVGSVVDQPAYLINYPLYFEPGYEDTLWDWFHWIDDPLRNPKMHMNFTARMELCCDTLQYLGVFGDGNNVLLGHKIKLPGKYYTDGRIKEIEVSYDPGEEIGQYIEIKGEM